MSENVAVLDFGSSKISLIVGSKSVNDNFNIVAKSETAYDGFIDGEFLEPNKLKGAISEVLNLAQLSFDRKIKKLFIGVPSEFCYIAIKELVTSFKKTTKIKQEHIDDLFEKSNSFNLSDTHSKINHSSIFYVLDNEQKVINPINCVTKYFSVLASFVFVENSFTSLLNNTLQELKINNFEYLASCLTESVYLLSSEEREKGAILVDCGYITTSIMFVLGEGLLDLKSFSMGGGHITADLNELINIPFGVAEKLKQKLILSLKPTGLDYYEINIESKITKVSAKIANDIALARIDKILEIIKNCIDEKPKEIQNLNKIYLTGGGISFLKGIKNYISQVLDLNVEILSPKPLAYGKPTLSSIISLLDTAIKFEQ